MIQRSQLNVHRGTHDKTNSWWAFDAMGIELCRVCDDCEHLLPELYTPEVLGLHGSYTDVVDDRIEEDY